MIEYCEGSLIGLPVGTANYLRDVLSLNGFNRMKVPFLAVPGAVNHPSYSIFGDERSGWYLISPGKWGFSLFGFQSYIFENGMMSMVNLSGKKIQFSLPTLTENQVQTYQNESGTIPIKEGLSWKDPVRVATIIDTTLSGTQTIDTISLSNGDRVLVWKQADSIQNGIYIVGTPWVRSIDGNSSSRLNGAAVFVQNGHRNIGKIYGQLTNLPIIDTDNIVWTEISGGSSFSGLDFYNNNSSTDIDIDLTHQIGWLTLVDEFGHYCRIKTSTWQFERGDDPFIKGVIPNSAQISITINTITNKPKIKVGSSSARRISYRFEGVEI